LKKEDFSFFFKVMSPFIKKLLVTSTAANSIHDQAVWLQSATILNKDPDK